MWEAVTTPTEDGFLAVVSLLDDPAYGDLSAERIAAMTPAGSLVLVADEVAMTIATIRCSPSTRPTTERLRVVARELWSVENNISLANMDWQEFTAAAGVDGVFRGF